MTASDPARRTAIRAGAAGGAASVLAGLGLAELTAALLEPRSSPIALVGSSVIDVTPPFVKDAVIAVAGTHDKLVLIACVVLGTLGISAAVGRTLRRSAAPLMTWGAIVGAIALCLGAIRLGVTGGSVIPGLVIAIVVALTAVLLHRRLDRAVAEMSTADLPVARPIGGAERRRLLAAIAGTAGVGIVGAAVGSAVRPTAPSTPIALPRPRTSPPALPKGLDVPGLSPLRTPASALYRIDTALVVPGFERDAWDLTIDGAVDAPQRFTLDEILAQPMVEIDATMLCVSNPIGGDLVGSVRFQGVEVAPLLERARPRAGSDQVLSTSADGFTAGTPLDVLLEKDRHALIVVGINGQPLSPEHGAPARLFTPGLYGYVGATKWLRKLTVGTFAEQKAYWTQRGWSERGPVKTATRIDTPRDGATVKPGSDGTVPIAGVAWAVHRGLSRVQVRIDGGEWMDAELGAEVNRDYWRQWVVRPRLAAGKHTAEARAADGSGQWQSEQVADVAPNGAQGYHRISFTVRG